MSQILEDNIHLVVSPNDAVEQFLGEDFARWVMDYVQQEVSSWPEMRLSFHSQVRAEKIPKFIIQCFLVSEEFWGAKESDPGLLGFALANLSEADDPEAEIALEILRKKNQKEVSQPESGSIHRQLWLRLLKGLAVLEEDLLRLSPKEPARNYIAEISDICSNSEWPTTMAAIAAYEQANIAEYPLISSMLKNSTKLSDADLEIFDWLLEFNKKSLLDSIHILEKISNDQKTKQLIWEGARRELAARKEFYKGLSKYLIS